MTLIVFCKTPIPGSWITYARWGLKPPPRSIIWMLGKPQTLDPGSRINETKTILDPGPGAKAPISHDDLDYLKNSDPWILDHLIRSVGDKAPTSLDHLDAWKSPDPWILDPGKNPILDSGPEAKAVTSLDDLDYLENSDP